MSPLAPVLQGFFTDKLISQRQASPHTIAAYRDTCRLLLAFASEQARKQPCQLDIADLDAPLRAPEHAAVISQVLSIPSKRCDRAIVSFLTAAEIDALLAAPGQDSWPGRRDHALLLVAVQT